MSSKRYPEHIMKIIREVHGIEPVNHNYDAAFQLLEPVEVFKQVLEWEGIIGYDHQILVWIRDIFKVDVVNNESFL